MRKVMYSVVFVSFALVSCINNGKTGKDSSTQMSDFEKQTMETFKVSFNEIKDKNESFENMKIVFSSDNLCIIHTDVKSSSLDIETPHKLEYIFLMQDGKYYEGFHSLKEDSIYLSESALEEACKGTLYENLGFEEAMFYRSAIFINTDGREVGNHNTNFLINLPIQTGLWEICNYVDEFGDKANGKYLRLVGKGTYSNNTVKNKKLIAYLFVDVDENIELRLVENNSDVVKGFWSCDMTIKDGEGEIYKIKFASSSGGMRPYFKGGYQDPWREIGEWEFRKIVEKEGELSMKTEMNGGLFDSKKSSYIFKFNLKGFAKAIKYLVSSFNHNSEFNESDDEYINNYPITREDPSDDEFDSEIESETTEDSIYSGKEPKIQTTQ